MHGTDCRIADAEKVMAAGEQQSAIRIVEWERERVDDECPIVGSAHALRDQIGSPAALAWLREFREIEQRWAATGERCEGIELTRSRTGDEKLEPERCS